MLKKILSGYIKTKSALKTSTKLSVLFIGFTNSLIHAQMDTSLIKIITRTHNHYAFTTENYCEETDTVPFQDTTAYLGLSSVTEYQYPELRTPDSVLNKSVNDILLNTFALTNPSQEPHSASWTCIFNKPFEEYMYYKVAAKTRSMFCITLFKDEYAAGGGSGAGHEAYPFTFDLRKKRRLVLGDILKKEVAADVNTIVTLQLKRSSPELFEPGGEVHNPQLFEAINLSGNNFEMNETGIVLYWMINYGAKHNFEEIKISFHEHPELFNAKKIKALLQN